MSRSNRAEPENQTSVQSESTFVRFTLGQRWEHAVLIVSTTVLLLTGLPQKYRATWGHQILTTPERLDTFQQIHHIAAIVLMLLVVYHLGRGFILLSKRRLSSSIFPNMQDVRDAWTMLKYLFFISEEKPRFGKFNFEQKVTYWFLFFALGIMVISGLILWFPIVATNVLPGGIVPAAKFAHSTEAIVNLIFVVLWHFFHVHVERLNLSIFTGRLNEDDMREFHALEYQRLTMKGKDDTDHGEAE